MSEPHAEAARAPHWPVRLQSLASTLREHAGGGQRQRAFEEAWLLLHSAVLGSARRHLARVGTLDPADLDDLASEKALDLLRRLESGAWDPSGRQPSEVAGFVSTVARNGLVDLFRLRGRTLPELDETDEVARSTTASPPETPEDRIARREFAEALRVCASHLTARDRLCWLLRAFHEFPTQDIARHREVELKPGHVDVILSRVRKQLTECLSRKGWTSADLPPGTFAVLWGAFRREANQPVGQPVDRATDRQTDRSSE